MNNWQIRGKAHNFAYIWLRRTFFLCYSYVQNGSVCLPLRGDIRNQLLMDNHQELNSINILIVDDHPLIREGLRKLLDMEPDINIMAEAGTGQQALEIPRHLQPDVVMLAINLPNLDAIRGTSQLNAERNQI